MLILRALLKYGMVNFTLVILEFSDVKGLLECEQKWIDSLKPAYNLSPLAGNSRGYKHTDETKNKLKSLALGRKVSEETRKIMSAAHIGQKPTTGIKVEVTDINTNVTTIYESKIKAAKGIGVDVKTLANYEKKIKQMKLKINNNLYKNKFIIKFFRDDSAVCLKGKGVKVEVTDITTNVTAVYPSILKAAKGIGINEKTLASFDKKKLNNRYQKLILIIISIEINLLLNSSTKLSVSERV